MTDAAVATPVAAPSTPAPQAAQSNPFALIASDLADEVTRGPQDPEGDPQKAGDANPGAQEPNPPPANEEGYWQPDEATSALKVKLKVNGKEMDLPVSELVKQAQLGVASGQAFREAAAKERQAEQRIEVIDSTIEDPSKFFSLGISHDEGSFLEWVDRLAGQAARYLQMTPEQRRLAHFERAETQRTEQAQQQQAQAAQQAVNAAWQKTLDQAQLPDDPIGHMIAAEMREMVQHAQRTGQRIGVSQLVEHAKGRLSAAQPAPPPAKVPTAQDRVNAVVSRPLVPATPPRGDDGRFQGSQPATKKYRAFG